MESFKRTLRGICARLDSRTLLPGESPRLDWTREGEAIEVRCGERSYRFPAEDTLVLPLANTSIELLARMIWHDLAPGLAGSRVDLLAVSVEESSGQHCWYEAAVSGEKSPLSSPAPSNSPLPRRRSARPGRARRRAARRPGDRAGPSRACPLPERRSMEAAAPALQRRAASTQSRRGDRRAAPGAAGAGPPGPPPSPATGEDPAQVAPPAAEGLLHPRYMRTRSPARGRSRCGSRARAAGRRSPRRRWAPCGRARTRRRPPRPPAAAG